MKLSVLRGAVLALSLFSVSASAVTISNITVLGQFANPTNDGLGNPAFAPVVSPVGPATVTSVSWGEPPVVGGQQSSYVFARNNPANQTLLPPPSTPFFLIGTFTHNNFVVDSPVLTGVDLNVIMSFLVDGTPTGPLTFTYQLQHTETDNTIAPGPPPCPFPTPAGEGCTDRVLIQVPAAPTVFVVNGIQYTLELAFQDMGVPVNQFITRENLANDAQVVGRFTAAQTNVIPEPQSFVMVGTALIGFGLILRRRRAR